jgi:uncharacterized SAM-binding protein YcdF (DUF218 family)
MNTNSRAEQQKMTEKYIRVLGLVLGYQLQPDGSPTTEFKANMSLATRLLQEKQVSRVIVSGGRTRPQFESEAVVGRNLVPADLQEKVWTEDQAMSTRQNFENCKAKLRAEDVTFGALKIICAPLHVKRARFLIQRYWSEAAPLIQFVTTDMKPTFRDVVVNKLIYWMTRIDPDEKVFLPLKRLWLD